MSFANKIVLITGASTGIGATTAISFAKEGAKVVILARNESNLKKTADEIKKIGTAPLVIKADITKDEDAKRSIDNTIDKYGKLDVLVNNAGILKLGTLLDNSIMATYDETMNTNVRAMVNLTSLAAPHLVKTKGNIVNISSIAGMKPLMAIVNAYGISKAAVNYFTLGAALELSPLGVRVNTISPGLVGTDFTAKAGIDIPLGDYSTKSLLSRYSTCEEIADLVLYLASDKAKGITGSNYLIDNGLSLSVD
ncbi:3-oxoacyl-[acyl-carrier-protein] reductase FabG-like [Achroia grisella]|uniref:3-oxoacyl-[acyl-carrier-protein] reductase FabG-like n=1 Tax=Achroia grisella TaxID=688607 RepID=UPI0027D206CE|nr:3-oxoacyl-[acyl-carrier-protein] reductase FabG-like [Achroia grisella]XP_059054171.1 3-oxoacyl-[acyl-carrier-protein] reductase FabG-like [Achroia grisella]